MLMDDIYNQANELEQIHSIQRTIDTVAALLLLTGQITIIGVFIRAGGIRFSIGGPIFGGRRIEGKGQNRVGSIIIDILDILLAILLLNDEINVEGAFIAPRDFAINISGPIFGFPKIIPSLPCLEDDFEFFQSQVSTHYQVPPEIWRKWKRDDQNVFNGFTHSKTL